MNTQVDFFNSIAFTWDDTLYVDTNKINTVLDTMNIQENFKILDVGTGTGVMIPFLLERMNDQGKITGVDISENMLKVAKSKFKDENRVCFLKLDIEKDTLNECYDFILCYSVFPHFQNKTKTIKKLINENLKTGGTLLIFHSQSREDINKIHQDINEIVSKDKLIPFNIQKSIFEKEEIRVIQGTDNKEMYFILIKKG